jgi:hypothetical protein
MADVNGHPDEATWERLAAGELDAAARDAAFDHITACERCSRIWRGLLTLKGDAQAQGLIPADVPARAPWRQSPIVTLAIAATLILAIGGVVINRRLNDQAKSRGNAMALVEEPATTTGADGVPTLTWKPTSGASQYRVEMFSEDGTPVWSLEAKAPPARWPVDVLRKAGTYRWRVEALNAGAVLARSRLVVLTVAP